MKSLQHGTLLAVAVVCVGTVNVTADDEGFKVAGRFSIASPGKGFTWKEVLRGEAEGIKFRMYSCMKEGSKSGVHLVVEDRTADTEVRRGAALRGHWNGLVMGWRAQGFTDLEATKPNVDPPLPDRVPYALKGKSPDGVVLHTSGYTVFGKRVYMLQAVSNSAEEAKELIKVVETLKDLKD